MVRCFHLVTSCNLRPELALGIGLSGEEVADVEPEHAGCMPLAAAGEEGERMLTVA